jgi:hypothetical protein
MAPQKTRFKWYWLLDTPPLATVIVATWFIVRLLDLDADLEFMITFSIAVVCAIGMIGGVVLLPRCLGSDRVESPSWFRLLSLSVFVVVLLAFILLRRH